MNLYDEEKNSVFTLNMLNFQIHRKILYLVQILLAYNVEIRTEQPMKMSQLGITLYDRPVQK